MRYLTLLTLCLYFMTSCHHDHDHGDDKHHEEEHEQHEHGDHDDHDHNESQTSEVNGFNEELAKKLGADDYGMHQYVMAFLKTGPNKDLTQEESIELQKGHMENIGRMAEEGKLVLAGPFINAGDLRGIYIFDVKTVEEAEELTKSDPAVQAGVFIMELYPWYGSAAVMQINEIHTQIAKINI